MQYILVENRQFVHLGPFEWKQRYIQSEIDDLEIDYKVAPKEQGHIVLEKGFEILPIENIAIPDHNPLYHQLAGPFYSYKSGSVEMHYTCHSLSIELMRANVKQHIAALRYAKENSGTTISIDGVSIPLMTNREQRNQYSLLLAGMIGDTIDYKVSDQFVVLNRQQLNQMIEAVNTHIQQSFTWEKNMYENVDAATTEQQLRDIVDTTKEQ